MPTREEILEAAEGVLRRYGPGKATVVDVARALGVSHGSVYRHFPSKAALREAVAEAWLARGAAPLADVAARDGPALERLRRWLDRLVASKRARAREDPELFATYVALAEEADGAVAAHVQGLVGQMTAIVADGMARGELAPGDPAAAARAAFDATTRFHHPAHAGEWSDPGIDDALDRVWAVVAAGLAAPASAARRSAPVSRTSSPGGRRPGA